MDQLNWNNSRLAMLVDQHVGERIRQRRTLLGFTQEQLAEALGISYQQVQKYETGANRVSAGRLFQIARRLDVDVAHFFEGIGALGGAQSDDSEGASSMAGSTRPVIDLVRNFQQIDDAGVRASVLALVRSLAGGASAPSRDASNDREDDTDRASQEPIARPARRGTNGSNGANGSNGHAP